jgi:hypothetical protein
MRTVRTCLISILAVLLAAHTASIAEEDSGRRAASYVPRLADLMVVIQASLQEKFSKPAVTGD